MESWLTKAQIKHENKESLKLEAASCRLLSKKLEPVKRALEKVVEREKTKRAERAVALSEYKSEQDIQDAYGWDLITDDERDQLIALLETNENYVNDTPTKASVALQYLSEFIGSMDKTASSFEFELLPSEEQAKRLAKAEEVRARAKARRAMRRSKEDDNANAQR